VVLQLGGWAWGYQLLTVKNKPVTKVNKRNAYRILVGKPEEKKPLGRPRRRWVDNIEMDLREIRWDGYGSG
jgi:hypothetical protein